MSSLIEWEEQSRLVDRLGAGWKVISSSYDDGPPYRLMILKKSKISYPILVVLLKLVGWKQWKEVAYMPEEYHGQKNHYIIMTTNEEVSKVLVNKVDSVFEVILDIGL